jgi:hypothetical protein
MKIVKCFNFGSRIKSTKMFGCTINFFFLISMSLVEHRKIKNIYKNLI